MPVTLFLRSLLWIPGVVCFVSSAFSQAPKKYTYTIGANAYQAIVLTPSAAVSQFVGTQPLGFEVFIHKNTYGYTYWEHRYKCPDIGFSLTYTDYLNPVLGESLGGTFYMNVPIVRFRSSELTVGLGTGLGYHTRPYRPPIEAGNILLGTPLTLTMRSQLNYTYKFSPYWHASLSAKLVHYSNAAYSKPNRGVNMPMMNVGISRLIGRELPAYADPAVVTDPEPYQRISYYLGMSTGVKTLESQGGRHSFVNLHAYTTLRFSAISGLTAGLDAFLDNATRQHIRQKYTNDRPDYRRLGLAVGHELFYDRLSVLTQLGVYLYRPYRDLYLPVYQRIGLRYAFTKHLLGNFTLKVHGGRAELAEFGLGARF